MKKTIGKMIAKYALYVTKKDVNCTCRGWCYQPLLPKETKYLKKMKNDSFSKQKRKCTLKVNKVNTLT